MHEVMLIFIREGEERIVYEVPGNIHHPVLFIIFPQFYIIALFF